MRFLCPVRRRRTCALGFVTCQISTALPVATANRSEPLTKASDSAGSSVSKSGMILLPHAVNADGAVDGDGQPMIILTGRQGRRLAGQLHHHRHLRAGRHRPQMRELFRERRHQLQTVRAHSRQRTEPRPSAGPCSSRRHLAARGVPESDGAVRRGGDHALAGGVEIGEANLFGLPSASASAEGSAGPPAARAAACSSRHRNAEPGWSRTGRPATPRSGLAVASRGNHAPAVGAELGVQHSLLRCLSRGR